MFIIYLLENKVFCLLVITLQPPFLTAQKLIQKANKKGQLIEIRLDLLPSLDDALRIKALCSLPVIFTLRKVSQGGRFKGSAREWEETIFDLLSYKPDYVDLEYDSRPLFFDKVRQSFPNTKIICSYHNFEKTPENLEGILTGMKKRAAAIYKMVTFARSSLDSLRMLILVQKQSCLSGMCMGANGGITRILGPVVGSALTYATVDKPMVPGQLPADVLEKTYHFSSLGKQTAIYALIGDPVTESRGHLLHNSVYRAFGLNAVYVKFAITPKEVPKLFPLIRSLPFRGFSVTMPLKQVVRRYLRCLDFSAKSIGAVNTLAEKRGHWQGFNTDGVGGLDAIEAEGTKVKGKKIVILGAGGTARALAFESILRGGEVWIVHRSEEKARQVSKQFGCKTARLDKWQQLPLDILINATPIGMKSCCRVKIPIPNQLITKKGTVFDAVARVEQTDLLRRAKIKGCKTISGFEMFFRQANRQIAIWFDRSVDLTILYRKIVLH